MKGDFYGEGSRYRGVGDESKTKEIEMNEFVKAREVMSKGLKEPDLRQGYKANIAMCIYDNRRKVGRLNHKDCNDVAEKIIALIFD